MKVMIVDDSALIRMRLTELLSGIEGVEVVAQAGNAIKALGLMREMAPDVAIVDVRMPKRSGLELLEDVKKTRKPPKMIMVTNFSTPENRDKCLSRGADFFFDKSSEIEEVMSLVKELSQDADDQRR